MKYRTRQNIFDTAWKGLKKQGFRKSSRLDYSCAYRGEDGTRCAIGYLIHDSRYSPSMEGLSPWNTSIRESALISLDDRDFAEGLQGCHDEADGAPDMERRLRSFADIHSLTVPA